MWSGARNLFMGGKALVVIIYDICDPKSEYFGGICFSVLINWRKKCANCYDKTSGQKCVNHQNRVREAFGRIFFACYLKFGVKRAFLWKYTM